MIYESSYWKDDLLRIAKNLKKRKQQKRFSERSFANIEKEIFFSFFAIRKLVESKKIPSSILSKEIDIQYYLSKNKDVTFINRYRTEQLYDLDRPAHKILKLIDICNLIIHGYVFVFLIGKAGGLNGVFVSSDSHRNNELYEIRIDGIILMLREIGNNYSNKWSDIYNDKKRDYDIVYK